MTVNIRGNKAFLFFNSDKGSVCYEKDLRFVELSLFCCCCGVAKYLILYKWYKKVSVCEKAINLRVLDFLQRETTNILEADDIYFLFRIHIIFLIQDRIDFSYIHTSRKSLDFKVLGFLVQPSIIFRSRRKQLSWFWINIIFLIQVLIVVSYIPDLGKARRSLTFYAVQTTNNFEADASYISDFRIYVNFILKLELLFHCKRTSRFAEFWSFCYCRRQIFWKQT